MIGDNKTFGIFLLDDKVGTKMGTIITEKKEKWKDINTEVFTQWLQGEGLPVAWPTLIKALRNSGRGELAKNIQAATTRVPDTK